MPRDTTKSSARVSLAGKPPRAESRAAHQGRHDLGPKRRALGANSSTSLRHAETPKQRLFYPIKAAASRPAGFSLTWAASCSCSPVGTAWDEVP